MSRPHEPAPLSLQQLTERAAELRRRGRLAEAAAAWRRALALAPAQAALHYNLANTLRDSGHGGDAVAHYERAATLRPGHLQTHLNLGNVQQELGRIDEAEAAYRRAITIDPRFVPAQFNLHAAQLHRGDVAGALASVEAARMLAPGDPALAFFAAVLHEHLGDAAAAAPLLRQAVDAGGVHRARVDAWRTLHAEAPGALLAGTALQMFALGLQSARGDGLVLEFGVRFGRSIRLIAGLVDGPVHGFDSFEGLPEAWHHEAAGAYSTHGTLPPVPPQVTLHAGWFEQTLPAFLQQNMGPVRFANIDCDLYSSTKTVLDALAPRIGAGTVLVFDEYIGNEHWRDDEFKAFQEAVAAHGWRYEVLAFSFATKQVAVRIAVAGSTIPR